MRTENIYDDLYQYLWRHLSTDNEKYFGGTTDEWVHFVTKAWLNDASNSEHRYHDMYKNLGEAGVKNSRILDISSGCGTFVFYGLLNEMDVYGIEPEHWKNTFNSMKVGAYNYPESWKSRFVASVGEDLPFKDNHFDIISSYQTLEHVQDVKKVLSEMIRCVKRRGAIFLKAPDYCSTFEGHYRLPWLPLFPRKLAKLYLKSLGRPTVGIDTIQYVTNRNVKRILSDYPVTIIDKRRAGLKKLAKTILNKAFRSENIIDLLIFKGINA